MNFFAATGRLVILLLLCLVWGGCFPPGNSGLDEQKDPHFLTGQDRVNRMDYKGAIESYEKALESNPQSASAHFELALLYEQREPNPPRAIYHFERYLELRPSSDRADIVKQRIAGCKQELAKSVTIAPGSPSLQRELEKYKAEVERLMVENTQLRQRIEGGGAVQPPVARGQAPQPTQPARVTAGQPMTYPTQTVSRATVPMGGSTATSTKSTSPGATRSHTIKPGETPSAIAKMYGVKLDKLMAANPSLDPRKLRPGQTLAIPAP